jgi:hypothetical protein
VSGWIYILEFMKKVYQQPITEAIIVEPSSVLCASGTIDRNPGNGIWGN